MKNSSMLLCAAWTIFFLFVNLVFAQSEFEKAFEKAPPFLALPINKVPLPLELGKNVVDVEAEYPIVLDRDALASDPAALSLDVYDGVRLEARRFRTRHYDGWMSWSGQLYLPDTIAQDRPVGSAVLVDHGNRVSGVIQIDATRDDFQIVGTPNGKHRLLKVKRNRIPSCGMPTHFENNKTVVQSSPTAEITVATTTEEIRIDVLAVVRIVGEMTAEIEDFIRTSVAVANSAFDYSNVGAFYNLVAIEVNPPGFEYQGGLFDYWRYMNGQWGRPIIENLRTAASADMVALFVDVDSQYCGVANLRYLGDMGEEVYVDGFANILWSTNKPAYSVQRIGCGLNDYTFGHELGHNFGLRHDYNDGGVIDPNAEFVKWPPLPGDPNPRGYEFDTWMGPRATVMGCYGVAAPCYRTHYYSDPNILWYGWCPTGNESEPYRANGATILRFRRFEYSRLRPGP